MNTNCSVQSITFSTEKSNTATYTRLPIIPVYYRNRTSKPIIPVYYRNRTSKSQKHATHTSYHRSIGTVTSTLINIVLVLFKSGRRLRSRLNRTLRSNLVPTTRWIFGKYLSLTKYATRWNDCLCAPFYLITILEMKSLKSFSCLVVLVLFDRFFENDHRIVSYLSYLSYSLNRGFAVKKAKVV